SVVQLINATLSSESYRYGADPQGRLIVGNSELMALELITDRSSPVFQSTANRLATRLMDYENPALAAPQRRFLMRELQRLWPQRMIFPLLAGEQLAAEASEINPHPARDFGLRRGALPDL